MFIPFELYRLRNSGSSSSASLRLVPPNHFIVQALELLTKTIKSDRKRIVETKIRTTGTFSRGNMRADAKKNYDHLLAVADAVIAKEGVTASLRDIARQADVSLATLFRHFPTREALLETLLRQSLAVLIRSASELLTSSSPDEALVLWFRDGVHFVQRYSGIVDIMAEAIANEKSALHEACTSVRTVGARLLERAQTEGSARPDVNGLDLFALMGGLGWISNQSTFAPRSGYLTEVVTKAIFKD